MEREGRTSMHRVVIALGGNALLRRGASDTYDEMYAAARTAAERIADVAAAGWEVVVTHGNGPQVGRILLQQEAAANQVHPMPLDVCGAESQGQIGYLLQVTIGDVFFERGTERPVATILTLTRVRPQDPAIRNPTKYVGPYLTEAQAHRREEQRGWAVKADPHRGGRRRHGGPTRGVGPGWAEPAALLDRRDAGDPPADRGRRDRDRGRRRRRP